MVTPPHTDDLTERARQGDADAQYALAAFLSQSGKREEADYWLKSAADNGCADALYTMATRRLYKSEYASEAAAQLSIAANRGSAPAIRLLGVMSVLGLGVPKDENQALVDVFNLAIAGEAGAMREIACLLALHDINNDNIGSLSASAGQKDPVGAAFALARAAAGRPGGDLTGCGALLAQVRYPRMAQLAASVFGGTPAVVNWENVRAKLSLETPQLPLPVRISTSPDVVVFRGAAAPEICEYLIAHSASRLGPSLVYDPAVARMIRDPLRTSATVSLSPIELDLALIVINRLMANAAGCDDDHGEFLSVLRYAPGQLYRPHFDCIPPGSDLDRNGQRKSTALLYLNDDYVGGETHFTEVDLKFRGRRGDILVFSNLAGDGGLDRSSRHAGLPVISGTKWLASKWLRTKKFQF